MIPLLLALVVQETTTYTTKDGVLTFDLPKHWSKTKCPIILKDQPKELVDAYADLHKNGCPRILEIIIGTTPPAYDPRKSFVEGMSEKNEVEEKDITDWSAPKIEGCKTTVISAKIEATKGQMSLAINLGLFVVQKDGVTYQFWWKSSWGDVDPNFGLSQLAWSARLNPKAKEPPKPEPPPPTQETATYTTRDGVLSFDVPSGWSRSPELEKETKSQFCFQGKAYNLWVISEPSTDSAKDLASMCATSQGLVDIKVSTPPNIAGADTHALLGVIRTDDPRQARTMKICTVMKNGIGYLLIGGGPVLALGEAATFLKIFETIRLSGEARSNPEKPAAKPRVWTGHANTVRCLAFSPDGKRLLSGSGDATLKLWDLESGKELATWTGHNAGVWSVAFLPDGKRAISASNDKTLKIWYVATGKEMATWTGHVNYVQSVAVSPDGKLAVSGSYDKTIRLWDVRTGKSIATWIGHREPVNAVAFHPSGKRVLSASNDTTLKHWDVESGKEIATWTGHSHYVKSAVFSPDGKRALSGSDDKTLKLWDVDTGKCVATWTGPTHPITSVAFNAAGDRALSGGYDNVVRLWDVASGKEAGSWGALNQSGMETWVECVAFTPDGKATVWGTMDMTIQLLPVP